MIKSSTLIFAFLMTLSCGFASELKNVVYDTIKGTPLHLDVYSPKRPYRSAPAIMYIHGGCFSGGSKDGIPSDVKNMTEDGFVVFSVQYRLSGVAKYPAAVQDVQAAIRFIRKSADRFGIDPKKIMTHGESAGGYLAAILGIKELPDRNGKIDKYSAPVAFVSDWFGRTDFTATQTTGSDCAESFLGKKRSPETMELFRKASVTHTISKDAARFIIIHGTKDAQVYPYHSSHLANQLARKEVPYELYFVDGMGHGFPRQTPWALTRQAMLSSIGKNLESNHNETLIYRYKVSEDLPLISHFTLSLSMAGGEKVPVIYQGKALDFHPLTRNLQGQIGIIAPLTPPVLELSTEDERDSHSLRLEKF